MKLEKVEYSIVIKVEENNAYLMPVNGIESKMSISDGIVIGKQSNYLGIEFISETNKRAYYKADNAIVALSSVDGMITIYEEGKDKPWLLNQDGSLLADISDKEEEVFCIDDEERKKSHEDIEIIIEDDIFKSYIVYKKQKYPLSKSLVIGDDIYGFKISLNITDNENTTIYPTHGPIYGIELYENSIRVFEKDKSIPWVFSKSGYLLGEADYNKLLRSEQVAYCERHKMTLEELNHEIDTHLGIPERKLS